MREGQRGSFGQPELGLTCWHPPPPPPNTGWLAGHEEHTHLDGLKLREETDRVDLSSLYTDLRILLSPLLKKLPHSDWPWPEVMPPMVPTFPFSALLEIIEVYVLDGTASASAGIEYVAFFEPGSFTPVGIFSAAVFGISGILNFFCCINLPNLADQSELLTFSPLPVSIISAAGSDPDPVPGGVEVGAGSVLKPGVYSGRGGMGWAAWLAAVADVSIPETGIVVTGSGSIPVPDP
jgi:hypothetical protein